MNNETPDDKLKYLQEREQNWLADAQDEHRGAIMLRSVGNALLVVSAFSIGSAIEDVKHLADGVLGLGIGYGGFVARRAANLKHENAFQSELLGNQYNVLQTTLRAQQEDM